MKSTNRSTITLLVVATSFLLASFTQQTDPTAINQSLLVGSGNKTWYFIKSNINGVEVPKPTCNIQGYMKFISNGIVKSNDCDTGIEENDSYKVLGNKLVIASDTVSIIDLSSEVLLLRYNLDKIIQDSNNTFNKNNYYEILLQTRIP